MAYVDAAVGGPFSDSQLITVNTEVASTNIMDVTTARKFFAGEDGLKIAVTVSAIGTTAGTFRARLVAADDSALTLNVETLDDTGTTSANLALTDLPYIRELAPSNQKASKRFYGLLYTSSGAATGGPVVVSAAAVLNANTNLNR